MDESHRHEYGHRIHHTPGNTNGHRRGAIGNRAPPGGDLSPRTVCLFGSVARGDTGPNSDYDIMLVVPDDAPPELRRSRAAYQALWGTGIASDVLVWTASQFNGRVHLAASLPATVLREGRLLHAA